MRQLAPTTAPSDFAGSYGTSWLPGVLAEHVELFVQAGGILRPRRDGGRWAVDETGHAVPVVCGELIQVWTEDGPQSGRCGKPATDDGACVEHSAIFTAWLADCREQANQLAEV